jgi:transposase
MPTLSARFIPTGVGNKHKAREPTVDVKTLHAKIGELALANDFFGSALTKAGLLSARK